MFYLLEPCPSGDRSTIAVLGHLGYQIDWSAMIAPPVRADTRHSVIDPTTDARWNRFVQLHPAGTIFHRSEWARVLIEVYGYEPRYHIRENDRAEIVAAWPAMLVTSRLTGRRLVTLPFSDHCGPLVEDDIEARSLFQALRNDAAEVSARRIEVRGWPLDVPLTGRLIPMTGYVRHVIDLERSRGGLETTIHLNTRRSVRRAEKQELTVRLAEKPTDIDIFFRLNLLLRRRHGMLPQPKRFFESIYRHLIEPGNGYILFAERHGLALAAVLCLRHNDVTLDKYAVNDSSYREYRGPQFVMWKSLQMEAERGIRWYDMGRSDASATGLHWFKEQWGADGRAAPYYYYPRPGGQNTADPRGPKKRLLHTFARYAPDSLFVGAGELAYRHLG